MLTLDYLYRVKRKNCQTVQVQGVGAMGSPTLRRGTMHRALLCECLKTGFRPPHNDDHML